MGMVDWRGGTMSSLPGGEGGVGEFCVKWRQGLREVERRWLGNEVRWGKIGEKRRDVEVHWLSMEVSAL